MRCVRRAQAGVAVVVAAGNEDSDACSKSPARRAHVPDALASCHTNSGKIWPGGPPKIRSSGGSDQ